MQQRARTDHERVDNGKPVDLPVDQLQIVVPARLPGRVRLVKLHGVGEHKGVDALGVDQLVRAALARLKVLLGGGGVLVADALGVDLERDDLNAGGGAGGGIGLHAVIANAQRDVIVDVHVALLVARAQREAVLVQSALCALGVLEHLHGGAGQTVEQPVNAIFLTNTLTQLSQRLYVLCRIQFYCAKVLAVLVLQCDDLKNKFK